MTQNNQTFIIGITGGIGSGKTQITQYFSDLGIHIVDADIIAREIVTPNSIGLKQISHYFGADILQKDGYLNRQKLRTLIFKETSARKVLEAITHPLINASIKQQLYASTSAYTILVSPLLLETQQVHLVDRILVADVSEQIQIERTCQRDKQTPQQVQAIIQAQLSRKSRLEQADDIVDNSKSIICLHQQLEKLHQHYLTLASNHTLQTK